MKFKTMYSIGDIVKYFCNTSYKLGRISRIVIYYDVQFGQKIQYGIEQIKVNNISYVSNELMILEGAIGKKIHKKAFEKEYARECAREIVRSRSSTNGQNE